MIQSIDTNAIKDLMPKPTQSNGRGARSSPDEVDATLQIQYATLRAEAAKGPQSDAEAVQRARELLLSGRLDKTETIREAAQDLLDFGV